MLYHIQTIHDSNGDCFRTALACLLDVERLENVPHFFNDNPPADEGWNAVREWLLVHKKLFMVTIPYSSKLEDLLECMKFQNPGIFYLLQGRSEVDDHVVICFEDKIIHDPASYPPRKDSLVGPSSDGYYWVKFFVPRFHGSVALNP